MKYKYRKKAFEAGEMTLAEWNRDAGNVCSFIIGNTRFGQEDIDYIEDCPFDDVADLELHVIKKWQERVNEFDKVFVLGVYAMTEEAVKVYTEQLPGRKFLIKSKGDLFDNKVYLDAGFEGVYDYPIIYRGNYIITPELIMPDDKYRVMYSLPRKNTKPIPLLGNLCCVSMEYLNYEPTYPKALLSKMASVRKMSSDKEKNG